MSTDMFAGQRSEISDKVDGLAAAAEAARGRLPDEILAPAGIVSGRAAERLRLSGEHTIVALAGATGSGKSSLFNRLTDLDLAGVGVRRPTTSWALACAWGPDGAQGLLEWMGIPARHQVSRMSMLDHSSDDTKLDGLVLLDLPDHDSTEVSHHLEMDRLVAYSDLLVWVLDPQKYADAAIHDRYIRPMASYSDVTLVVLNQIDRIEYQERERALADVRRILADEGLPNVPVIGVSAVRGDGIDDLKRELAKRIRAKASAKERLGADVAAAAQKIVEVGGSSQVPGISQVDRETLETSLAEGAGISQLVQAIGSSTRRRAEARTSWPVTRWLGRMGKDPLKELGVKLDMSSEKLTRNFVPAPTPVQRAHADAAIRDFAGKASVGLAPPWRDALRDASTSDAAGVVDAIDQAVLKTELGIERPALWWRLVNGLQWIGFLALVVGLGWLGLQGIARVTDLSIPTPPEVLGFALPLLLVAVGAVGGVLVGLAGKIAARTSARRRAQRAASLLRASIGEVADARVIAPIQTELDLYERYRAGITRAL